MNKIKVIQKNYRNKHSYRITSLLYKYKQSNSNALQNHLYLINRTHVNYPLTNNANAPINAITMKKTIVNTNDTISNIVRYFQKDF